MTDKTDALIRKLAIHVRPTCSELYDEAMQALAEQPAASVDVDGLRALADEQHRHAMRLPATAAKMLRHYADKLRALIDSAGGAVPLPVGRVQRGRAPHDNLYAMLLPTAPRTPAVKEGDLLYTAPPAASVGDEVREWVRANLPESYADKPLIEILRLLNAAGVEAEQDLIDSAEGAKAASVDVDGLRTIIGDGIGGIRAEALTICNVTDGLAQKCSDRIVDRCDKVSKKLQALIDSACEADAQSPSAQPAEAAGDDKWVLIEQCVICRGSGYKPGVNGQHPCLNCDGEGSRSPSPAASVDVDCLKQIRALLQSLPSAQGREHIDLGIRLNRMIDAAGGAKGSWRCACGDMNAPNETCGICNQSAPQPAEGDGAVADALVVVNDAANDARHAGDYAKANALVRARVTLYRASTRPAATAVVPAFDFDRARTLIGYVTGYCNATTLKTLSSDACVALCDLAAMLAAAPAAPAADEEAAEQFRKGWQAGFAEGRRDQQPAAVDGSVELLGALQVAELALRERGLQATGEYRQIETTLAKHAAQQAEGGWE